MNIIFYLLSFILSCNLQLSHNSQYYFQKIFIILLRPFFVSSPETAFLHRVFCEIDEHRDIKASSRDVLSTAVFWSFEFRGFLKRTFSALVKCISLNRLPNNKGPFQQTEYLIALRDAGESEPPRKQTRGRNDI